MATKNDLGTGVTSPGSVSLAAPAQATPLRARLWQVVQLRWATPYLFLLPFLVVFVAFFVAPFIYDVSQSFYTLRHAHGLGLTPAKVVWVGADNYLHALQDARLWDGLRRVLLYGIVQIPIMMIVALLIALLMDSAVIRFRNFFRLAAFLPYAVPSVVAAIMWGFFYTPKISPIIQGLQALHVKFDFLSQSNVLWSIANISTWEFTGYNMIIFFAALQAIPQEIYESGRLDGLSEIGIARFLKVPMIAPALVLGLLFSLIGTLQLFNEPELLRNLSGAISTSYTPNIYAYNVAIFETNFYYGGAIAAILGTITFVFSFVFLRLTRSQSGV